MGIVKTLWKVVRRPMTRWWVRNGSWWLVGIAVLTLADSLILHGIFPLQSQITLTSMKIVNSTNFFMPLMLVVVAASACDEFIFKSYEQQAAPMPNEVLWGRYLLALSQAIPIAVTISIASTAFGIYQLASGLNPSGECPFAIWIFTNPLTGIAGYAVSALWLVLFVVLATNRPIFKYGLLFASFLALSLSLLLYLTIIMSLDHPFSYSYSESRLLFLLALPLWLIFAYALKQEKFKTAYILLGIIMVSIIGNTSFVLLYGQFGGSLLKGIAFVSEFVNSPYHSYSQIFPPVSSLLGSGFNPEQTVLGYLPFIIKPLLSWLQPCFLLGLIYLFVFSSYPKGWVDYLRKKLPSSR